MKSAVAIIAVFLIALPVFAVADFSTAEDSGEIKIGAYTYSLIDNTNEVELISYDNLNDASDVIIPAEIIDDKTGNHYDVTRVSAWFASEKIKTITIGENVEVIEDFIFNCQNLRSFAVSGGTHFSAPDDVLYTYNQHKLIRYPVAKTGTSYEVLPSVAEIGACAFYESSLETVILHEGIIKMDSSAFYCCANLSNLRTGSYDHTLPDSLSIIGNAVFGDCTKLTSITLPEGLVFIGTRAFANTGISEMLIPYEVDYIGEGAFMDCYKMTKFESYSETYWSDEKTGILYKEENEDSYVLFAYPANSDMTEFEIPENVVNIAPFAFSGCQHLEKVTLNETTVNVPELAFCDCKSLKSINLDGIITIGSNSFSGCENLSAVNFGNSITYIGMCAFSRTALESVAIPSSVTYIDYGAFQYCPQLSQVTISEGSKVTLDWDVFYNDTALKDITIESGDVVLSSDSLCIGGYEGDTVTVNVHVVKGYTIPADATDEYTILYITIIGERPYPWENWIGVFFCALVIIGILYGMREV